MNTVGLILEAALDGFGAAYRDGHWAGEVSFRYFATGEPVSALHSAFPITDTDGWTIGYGTSPATFAPACASRRKCAC